MNRLLLFALLTLTACGGSGKECRDCDAAKNDTVAPVQDPAIPMVQDTAIAASEELKDNHAKIVKKYGEQWDFCKCVVANDSITDAAEKGTLTDKQYEVLMSRWEYVDLKCKELTTFDNTTPEEREKHEKRVNKCLRQNGLKR